MVDTHKCTVIAVIAPGGFVVVLMLSFATAELWLAL